MQHQQKRNVIKRIHMLFFAFIQTQDKLIILKEDKEEMKRRTNGQWLVKQLFGYV